jgi:outer membrane usher protein
MMYMSRATGGAQGSSFGASLNIPLEKSRQVGTAVSSHGGSIDAYATAAQSPDADTNLGWRVLAGALRKEAHAEAGVYYTGRYGRLFGDLSASGTQTGLRAGVSGGLVAADGHLFATRRVDQSFALAEVAGHGNIGIGVGSNVLTRTDAGGIALIPQLSPYQSNSIRVDPKELPISAEIGSIEQVVVPSWRSAVKASFPVRSGIGALIKFTLDDGDVAPAGALVRIEGDAQEFHVARRGEAFVTGLKPRNRLLLHWKDRDCAVEVNVQAVAADQVARLGPLRCAGVTR